MTSLPLRRLGTTDLEITPAGFGSWAAGGPGWAAGWGAQDDEDSLAAMRHALALGINWIDTAAVYGLGHAEEVVGRLLRELPTRERPLVFTKCGLVWNPQDRKEPARRIARPETIRRECEDSLRRLGVDVIDLYQIHWPDASGTPVEDGWEAMLRLAEVGKIRYPAVSNFDVAALERCERLGHVASLQPPFSMIRRSAASAEIPWCEANGTGVIVYSPMQSGLLTGRFSAERLATMDAEDWRRGSAHFQSPKLEQNLALGAALEPIAARHGVTVGAVAVAWTLAWRGVTGAIVGARTPAQVDGWIAGATLSLDASDLDAIAAAIERTGAGEGPARP